MPVPPVSPRVKNDLNGILLVNKPVGLTSYDVIRWFKREYHPRKIGHAGTLDPLASGLLVFLLGHSTKVQDQVMALPKTYRVEMKWGIQTDTADITGNVIQTSQVPNWTASEYEARLDQEVGPQLQTPPMYSALKKDGVPLYKLARKGKTVEREARPIRIFKMEYISHSVEGLTFRVVCSGGTYVRTLVETFALKGGYCATMTGLVRESVGGFGLSRAVEPNQFGSVDLIRLNHLMLSEVPSE